MPNVGVISSGALTTELDRRLRQLTDGVMKATQDAAKTATDVSRQTFGSQEIGRPVIPARPRRSTTGGNFTSLIDWVAHRASGNWVVDLDLSKLEQGTRTYYGGAGYWLIQEIGTGKEAAAYVGEAAAYERRFTVSSQIGRAIPFGLTWGQSGASTSIKNARAAGSRLDQIVPVGLTPGASGPVSVGGARTRIIIGREIEGKHYLRDGGVAGFQQFRTSALAVARQAFAGRPRRP